MGTEYRIIGKVPGSSSIPSPVPVPDLADPTQPDTTIYRTVCGVQTGAEEITPGVGANPLTVKDEGNIVARTTTFMDFIGLGVQAASNDDINVTITVLDQPVQDEAIQIAANLTGMDFEGAGVTAVADPSGFVTVTIPATSTVDVLNDLSDVIVPNPNTGEALVWNGSSWVNAVVSTVAVLDDLTDVTITGVVDNEVLTFDQTSGQWENKTPQGSGVTELDDLSDVTLTQIIQDGDRLFYELATGQWKNKSAIELEDDVFIKVRLREAFDGVRTTFTMEDWDDSVRLITVINDRPENIIASLDGVLIESRIDYTVAGSLLGFATAPESDANYTVRAFTVPSLVFLPPDFITLEDDDGVLLLEDGSGKLQLEN